MPVQSTALPYRFDGDRCEVLLVTSRRRGKWILPKGKIEKGETAADRAAAEAYEEAGVIGIASATPLLAAELIDSSRPKVHPLAVEQELETWPEMYMRQRAWFTLTEAREILRDELLRRALTAFAAELPGLRRAQENGDA
ncbi:NUDIX domain-containing protein [Novosphingobium resinovorum]|uniref:NUDIX hydrolase n=1 Tax=Novosphingobium TaxID=165696 RepID=UPI001B3C87BA|nr:MULTISPECIES: NUDIX domain-containing protein [Novosphingobium]MBF7013870.1 NUDIX domain-containing protein [Novosphingobium sp. HR1a]WJM26018.1 NUDIX domain-containing protein [Novosphingobium resinovorum]